MPQKRKFLKNTALKTAFSAVLLTVTAVPLIGLPALFLSVAPLLIIARSRGVGAAIASGAVVLAAAYLIGGGGFLAAYGILFFCYGIWYYKVLTFTADPAGRIINAAVGWIVLAAFFAAGANYLFGVNLLEEVFINLRLSAGTFVARYIDLGMPEMRYTFENIVSFLFSGFGGLIAIFSLGGSWLVYLALSLYGGEKPLNPLEKFRLPEELIWPLMASGLLFFIGGKFFPGGFLQMAGANAGLLMLAFYFVSGAATAFFLMKEWKLNKLARGTLLAALVFFLNGVYILTALGIADVWINFRKKFRENNN